MSSAEPILEIQNLTKRFRTLVAVDALTMNISPGEFVGLIGPNGAGKSTTMGCIAGTVAADEGTVYIDGVEVSDEPVQARRQLGFVPQHLTLLDYLTGLEYLHFVADLRELDTAARDRDIDELLSITELNDHRDTIIREYSGGMLRKLALASALIGAPKLLVLDESFVGLDPESTYRLRKRLEHHCNEGGAILLSSHILDMLEPLCDRFVILDEGSVARDLSQSDFAALRDEGVVEDLTDLYLETTGKKQTLRPAGE